MLSSTIIPIPANDKDFEQKCVPLFAALLKDPNVKTVGVSGQGQKGLDLIGRRDRDPRQPVGIQCKLRTKGDKLTEKQVRDEVEAALKVAPALTEYYLVSTAPDDTAMDLLAVTLSQEQANLGRTVDIQIWGWETLQQRIRGDVAALKAFDPGQSPTTDEILRLSAETFGATQTILDTAASKMQVEQLHAAIIAWPADTDRGAALDVHLDEEIDRYRDLLNQGKPRTALALLEGLDAKLSPKSSAKIRARVKANIGWAWLRQGQDAKGGQLLLDAYVINPADPKTIGNRVFGLCLTGQIDEAVAFGRQALIDDPTNAGVATFLLQAAAMSAASFDPLAIIPAALLEDENVKLNQVNYARFKQTPAQWRALAAQAYAAFPNGDSAEQLAAEAMLDEAFETNAFERNPVLSAAKRHLLERAAELFARQWDRVRGFENADQPIYASIAVNLANAWRALGRPDRAAMVIDQAALLAPAHQDVRLTGFHVALERNAPEAALLHLEAVAEGPEKTVPMLLTLARLERWDDITAFATAARRATLKASEQVSFDALAFRARIQTEDAPTIVRLARELVDAWPQSIGARVVAADALRQYDVEEARTMAAQAAALLTDETPYGDRIMLSQLASEWDDYDTVILALDGYVPTDAPSARLARLTWAFANGAPRPRTHAFFESLSAEVQATPRFARLVGSGESARGDLRAAERHLRVAVQGDGTDLRAVLVLHSVLHRQNRKADAEALVRNVDEAALVGEPMDQVRLAFALARAGETPRAMAYGYKVARDHRDDPEVAGSYPTLIFTSDRTGEAIGKANEGGLDLWFDLQGQGIPDVSGVIEREGNVALDRYPPDHALAVALTGKKVGDAVVLARELGPESVYTLRELKPKYVWLLHEIMHSHATRFPEATNLFQMTMVEGDVQPVLDVVRQLTDRDKAVERLYTELPVPLAAIAAASGRSVIEFAERMTVIDGQVRTCVGSVEERDTAIASVRAAQNHGVVLDTLTAWTAYRLGVLEGLKAYFGRLVLPRSSIDDLMELREKRGLNADREFLTVGFEGEQAVRTLHTAEDTAQTLAVFDKAIEALNTHCEVLPTDGSDDLRIDSDLVDRFTAGEILDPIHLARQCGLPLLSDDLHLRLWAEQDSQRAGAWLQTAIWAATAAGNLTRAEQAAATARLAHLRHGHVWLEAYTLVDILKLEDAPAEALFNAALAFLAGPNAEMTSHLSVAVDFMVDVLKGDVDHGRALRAIAKTLGRLIDDRVAWRLILFSVHAQLRARARGNLAAQGAREALRSWSVGHFYGIDYDRSEPPDAVWPRPAGPAKLGSDSRRNARSQGRKRR